MAQILDLGKLRFNWKGVYNNTVEYSYNDIAKYGANLYAYKATTATTGNIPTNTTYWNLISEGIVWRGTYTASDVYFKNDLVTDGTSTYIVTTAHTATNPAGTLPNANTSLLALGQSGIPNQASNANKVLTTNGTATSWTATTRLTKEYIGGAQGAGAENFETSAALTNAISVYSGSTNNFVQFPIVNTSNGTAASTDFIAYTANGTNDDGWIDMGITSATFDDATYGITGPHDGYIFQSAPKGTVYDVATKATLASVATLTTTLPHGYSVGNQVRVTDVGEAYDGLRTVTAVSSTTFSFATTGSPEASTAVSPAGNTWKPAGDGNLVLATSETGKLNKIIFAAGGLTAGTTQMEITPDTNVHIEIDTQSVSSTTGALTVNGGIGVAGNLNVAGDLDVNGTVDFSGVTELPIGSNANTFLASLTNPVVVIDTNDNDYAQVAFQNRSANANASTDFIAYSNNGTDSAGYIDMGITSSAFNDPEFTITGPGDGYIFMVGATGGTDKGNLVFATGDTGSENKIIFAAGGLTSNDEQMSITPGENVHIEIATASTSPTTGALTVVGGVGIQGDVNIQGNIVFGGEGTQVGTANLAVEAPFIFTGDGSTSQTNDLGVISEGKYIIPTTLSSVVENRALTSNVVTLTTRAAHNYLVGDSVVVAGIDATFNGTYTVASIPTSTTFTYAKTNANVASARLGDQTFSINNKALVSNVATLTTTATHPYLVGESVTVTNVDSTFNGTYTITAVTSTTFSYEKTEANVTSTAVSPTGTALVNQSASTAAVANPVRTRFTSWSKDATDGVWKLASNIITQPTTTIDYGQAGLVYDAIKVGSVDAAGLTLSSTLTGGASSNIAINTNKFTVNATSGNTAVGGTLAVTGIATLTGGAVITGTTEVNELRESVGNITLSSNVGTFDWTTSNVFYIETAPSAAMTFSFTNVPTDNNYMMTTNVFVTQGATGRIPTTLNINGSAATIRWANGLTPTGTNGAGKIDIFTFSFHRVGGAWIVYASANQNF
jgi:hypothetical protein